MLKQKNDYKFKKNLKAKPFVLNSTFHNIIKKNIKYKVSIKITANNIFCSLKQEKMLMTCSAGKYKIIITKRKLKFNSKLVLESFFIDLFKFLKKDDVVLINLSAPKKLRKLIIKQIYFKFKDLQTIIKVNELKCFNGCRPKKQRRKKQKGLRILKK